MKAYKGFNKDMTCRGFRFEEGKTYEEKEAELCKKGFHACEHPLACYSYYSPSNSVFHEVEVDGVADERGRDTKLAAKKITIGARLDIAGMVKAAVDFVFAKADWSKREQHATGDWGAASATGDCGAASATGYLGAASATGYLGAASATGDCGAASATGYLGAASATGDCGAASATGYLGAASATGVQGAASATGYHGAASATGYRGTASATGDWGAASATGYQGAASATGDHGAASATGYQGAASATGDRGAASATGYQGAASATGDQGAASATGDRGAAVSLGIGGKAKAALGCWITLAEWKKNEETEEWERVDVQTRKVDGMEIFPDTWYTLRGGEFVEEED